MDWEILLETFKQKLYLPAAPVQVQDFFAAVFCAKGCNNRDPSSAEQRFCLDLVLVFRSFAGFTFPCFCCLSIREPVSDYPYKACRPGAYRPSGRQPWGGVPGRGNEGVGGPAGAGEAPKAWQAGKVGKIKKYDKFCIKLTLRFL